MNHTAAYTPLESLLLFQSLLAYGTEPGAFARISELLTNCELVKDADTYDPTRLNPEALRELYLHLLREEIRDEVDQVDGNDVDSTPGDSKKRKLHSQSHSLPTVKDASQYRDKLPYLVEQLYARYRAHKVRLIREDESRYEVLEREIREIENGEWDERILAEDRAKHVNGNGNVDTTRLEPGTPEVISKSEQEAKLQDSAKSDSQRGTPQAVVPSQPSPKTERREISVASETAGKAAAPSVSPTPSDANKGSNGSTVQSTPILQPKASNSEKLQAASPAPAQIQKPGAPKPEGQWKWQEQYPAGPPGTPGQAQQKSQHHPQAQGFPPYHYNQYPPRGYPPGQPYPPAPNQLPSSPHHIQPHPVVPSQNRPAVSPQPTSSAEAAAQFRTSGQPATPQGVPPAGYRPPASVPSQFRPGENIPTPTTQAPSHWTPQYAAQFAQAQGFPYTPQTQRSIIYSRPDLQPPETRQYTSPYVASNARRAVSDNQSSSAAGTPRPTISPLTSQPQTPLSQAIAQYRTGRATKWTPTPSSNTPKAPRSPVRPTIEPLSPVLTKTPVLKATPNAGDKKSPNGSIPRRQRPRPSRSAQAKIDRGVSPAASSSRRSQSVASHADELSAGDSSFSRLVKQESATPQMIEDTEDTTADEGSIRKSLDSPRPNSATHRSIKRKRHESPSRIVTPPTHVIWTKNFPAISQYALSAITSHRCANTFAAPVKERDAPGYRDIILRPQDLKSIRSAIHAGNRAATAAAASCSNDNSQTNLLLPISEDLVPPKGIINASQLENEVIRMFANAIMYNADPNRGLGKLLQDPSDKEPAVSDTYEFDENGVVNETRAMFTDVEKILNDFRKLREDVGNSADDDENDAEEPPADNEANTGGSVAKRRRRA